MPAARAMLPALIVGVALAAGACGDAAEPTACGEVGFSSQTAAGAFDITAVGVDCATARGVAGASRTRPLDAPPYGYRVAGFSCEGKPTSGGALEGVEYRCIDAGERVVAFTRT